jgi:hypothetical protein
VKILILLLCLLGQTAIAGSLVLLTSFSEGDSRIEKKLERIFSRKLKEFSSVHQLVIKHKADQEDLHFFLSSAQTKAVLWVSHGSYVEAEGAMRPTPMLLDHNKDNVAKVFGLVNPSVKFVGVIGCNSKQVLEGILPQGLKTYIPDRKVIAQFALRRALRRLADTDLSIGDLRAAPKSHTLTITRKVMKDSKSLQVLIAGKLVGLVPKAKAGTTQSITIRLDQNPHQKVKLDSAQNPFEVMDQFGVIQLDDGAGSQWKLFSRPDGTPFGTNERIFLAI